MTATKIIPNSSNTVNNPSEAKIDGAYKETSGINRWKGGGGVPIIPVKNSKKGGKVTKSDRIKRQVRVEQLLLVGYSATKICNYKEDGQNLGSINAIKNDINEIKSRWLELDPTWFNRARIARLEAVERLKSQLVIQNKLILNILKGEYDKGGDNSNRPNTLTYAQSHLTVIIKNIYDIDSDFDPEQYLDEKIRESINAKLSKAKAKTS